jgi:hypothetical protein
MGTLLSTPNRAGANADVKSIFDRFARQVAASVHEFNALRGGQGLSCERTPNRIAVYKEPYPRITMELEYDEVTGTVRMKRQKLEHPSAEEAGAMVTDLQFPVDRRSQVHLGPTDYCRLAQQALRPLIDALE